MAPMVTMADFQMPRTDAAFPHTRRKQRIRLVGEIGEKYRTFETRQMSVARAGVVDVSTLNSTPPSRPISQTPTSNIFPNDHSQSLSARIPIRRDEQSSILKRRQGLLRNLLCTIELIRRNYILEKKIEALRLETRSVVNTMKRKNQSEIDRTRESSLQREEKKIDDFVTSTTDEKSSCKIPESVRQRVEEWRRTNFFDGQNQFFVASTPDSPSSDMSR